MKKTCIFCLLCLSAITSGKTYGANRWVVRQAFTVYDIRCQLLVNPVGIGESRPSFSRKLSSSKLDVTQTAYQIIITSSRKKMSDDPNMWNSGKIFSGQNTFIHYAGKRLQKVHKYFWKLRVWTNKDKNRVWGNIDDQAKAGMCLTDAHASSSVFTPSRYSILTGRYDWRSRLKAGVLGSYGPPLIDSSHLTIADILKAKYATVIYKKVGSTFLKMDVLFPSIMNNDKSYPCIAFFFGGGWLAGSINDFKPEAEYFTKRNMVCFLVDYRVRDRQGTTPFDALRDAKSAIRFIREHANTFHIDKNAIVAAGESAGGQLAAATALDDGYNDPADDLSISAKPNALVLSDPVIDNGPGGYGFNRIGDQYKAFSPLINIKKGAPPTIFFLGIKDKYIPVATAKYYMTVMQKVGSRCDLFLFKGAGHGFRSKKKYMKKALSETDKFLTSLGYIRN